MPLNEWFFLILSVGWLLEFILFKGQRQTNQTHSTEQKSYYLILFSIIVTVLVSLYIRELSFLPPSPLFMAWLALFIYGIGIFLRYWSMMTLKHEFTRHVQVSGDQKLVSHGPYHLMRHPLYTALLVCVIGLSGYLASWVGMIVTLCLVLPALLFRIKVEEDMLSKALGVNYDSWKQQRWILVPWIY